MPVKAASKPPCAWAWEQQAHGISCARRTSCPHLIPLILRGALSGAPWADSRAARGAGLGQAQPGWCWCAFLACRLQCDPGLGTAPWPLADPAQAGCGLSWAAAAAQAARPPVLPTDQFAWSHGAGTRLPASSQQPPDPEGGVCPHPSPLWCCKAVLQGPPASQEGQRLCQAASKDRRQAGRKRGRWRVMFSRRKSPSCQPPLSVKGR